MTYTNTSVVLFENTKNATTTYEFKADSTANFCESFLYYFAFWIITLSWILFLFGLVCPCGFIFLIP
jgi:hypothetical protein